MKLLLHLRSALGLAVLFAGGVLLGLGQLSGCGNKSPDSSANAKSESQPPSGNSQPKSNAEESRAGQPIVRHVAANGGRKRGVYTDANGQKWWNNHPYDIWYRDAYKVAGNSAKVGGGQPGNGGGNKVAKKDPPKTGMKTVKQPTPMGGGNDWKSIADIADLETEVKLLRNYLQQKMKTPASFRQDYKRIESVGSTLAALGQVLSQHPSQSNLKRNALYVRDLGLAISEASVGRGPTEFRKTKIPFEQLIDTLNGSPPAGLKKPKADASFFDVADRGGLMRRMDETHKWLDKEINTAAKMKSEAERVKREATIFAVLVKVIGNSSYDSADDTEYKGHVLESLKQTDNIKAALKTGDFASYQKSVSTIFNRCNECHNKYRQ